MNFLLPAKALAERLPRPLGQALARVPFGWRLGPAYTRAQEELEAFEQAPLHRQKSVIAGRVQAIVGHACAEVPFYRDLYALLDASARDARSFDGIAHLPLVTREELQRAPLAERSSASPGRMKLNTGGTSGEPLAFYVDRHAFAREWAHMHFIWSQLGYHPTDVKLTVRGRNLGRRVLVYNAVHNEYLLNTYAPLADQAAAVRRVAGKLKFVHGYPSALYAFLQGCAEHYPGTRDALRNAIEGVLLGSEFPAPVYRDLIERELEAPSVSWYGHSEMALLAMETEPYLFRPLHSYGYAEAVAGEGDTFRLVGTSYGNTASPFIRYDTGDLVEPRIDGGLLQSFRVREGRTGEFIHDAEGQAISLTALIFGRHHALFDHARFIQVVQKKQGHALLLVTPTAGTPLTREEARAGFDASGVRVEFDADVREEPVRSKAGKVPLLVKDA